MDVYHLSDDSDQSFTLAQTWLNERAANKLIIVPLLRSIDNSPVLRRMKAHFIVLSSRNLKKISLEGTSVLMAWPSREMLDEVDRLQPLEVLVVVGDPFVAEPWLENHTSQPYPSQT